MPSWLLIACGVERRDAEHALAGTAMIAHPDGEVGEVVAVRAPHLGGAPEGLQVAGVPPRRPADRRRQRGQRQGAADAAPGGVEGAGDARGADAGQHVDEARRAADAGDVEVAGEDQRAEHVHGEARRGEQQDRPQGVRQGAGDAERQQGRGDRIDQRPQLHVAHRRAVALVDEQRRRVADAHRAALQPLPPGIVGVVVGGDAARALPAVVVLAAELARDAGDEERRDHGADQQRGDQRPGDARRPGGGAIAERPPRRAGERPERQRPVGDVLVQDVAAEKAEDDVRRRPAAPHRAGEQREGDGDDEARCGCWGCATGRRPRTTPPAARSRPRRRGCRRSAAARRRSAGA